jgi:hypothetical protein
VRSNRFTLFTVGLAIATGLSAQANGFFDSFLYGRKDSQLIRSALSDHSIQDGRSYTIHTNARQTCTNSPLTYTDEEVNYWLTRKDGEIVIDLPIMYSYRGAAETHDEAFARVEKLEKCVVGVYQLNGLKLNLTLTEGDPDAARAYGYSYVNIWDNLADDNASNWTTLSDNRGHLSTKEACAKWSRGVGKLLGLPNRYADPACPDRPGIEKSNDLMAETLNPEVQVISEDDMAIILKPFSED